MSISQDPEKDETTSLSENREHEDIETSSSTSEDSDEDEVDDNESEDEDEVIARKLGEQLLEDVRRAREAASPLASAPVRRSPKEEAALTTIKTVLSFATSDHLVRTTFSNTTVPGSGNTNVFDMLTRFAEEGRISPQAAGSLSHVLVKLAKTEVLFSPLPRLPPETLKRKRDGTGEESAPPEKRATA